MNFLKKILKTAILSSVSVFFAFFTFIFTVVFFAMVLALILGSESDIDSEEPQYRHVYGEKKSDNQLHSIPITGIILGETHDLGGLDSFALSGITYGYEIKDELLKLAEKDDTQGLILEIHSPGGTIYGTQAIVDGVEYYKEKTGKPVVAYIGSMAASGGYWVATSADTIVADAGTGIGSIGVIQGPFKYYDSVVSESYGAFLGSIETQNGITTEYITAGNSKDLGNPHRRLTDEERVQLQQGAENAYSLFVTQVSTSREMSEETVREKLGAFVYDEQQARALNLIDGLGSKEQAYHLLAEQAGVTEYEVLQLEPLLGFFDSIFGVVQDWSGVETRFGSVCPLNSTVLAYYGDVASVCQ